MMDIGVMLRRDVPPENLLDTARAVAAMVDELWVVEDLNWPGGVAELTAVLEATDDVEYGRPVVGHGVAPAPFRNPVALAMEWATLARMYPGRLHAGIGHGVPDWMDRIGEKVASPLTLLRETIESTRAILAGGPVSYSGRYVNITDVELVFPPAEPPPVLAGVTGPRSLELAGTVADGTLLSEGHDVDQIRSAQERVAVGRTTPGAPEHHRFTQYVGYYLGDIADLPPQSSGPETKWAAVAPGRESLAEQLQAIIDTGIDSMVLVPFGDTVEQLIRFHTEVRPRLRLQR